MATEGFPTRRRIIERPRLTKLLDSDSARIKLLVAPAGYGKTTLAQQWLSQSGRRVVWYRGSPASADVAALAAKLSLVVSEIVPSAGKRMRERLRATGDAEEDVEILGELFAEDVQEWPEDAWLAIDDYHSVSSAAADRFVDLVAQLTPTQMILTSRRRPGWITARRILYGEVQEVDRRALAMNDDEAARLLAPATDRVKSLIGRARGWPAVLGLAALNPRASVPDDDLPEHLYEYFAEELYRGFTVSFRDGLHRLALVPGATLELARRLVPKDAADFFEKGVAVGALNRTNAAISVHPLLRTFLNKKLATENSALMNRLAEETVAVLMTQEEWDAAFHVVANHASPHVVIQLVEAALYDLLRDARTHTILSWLEFADRHHLIGGALDLAEAEVVFRQGDHARAEALAAQAATSAGPPLRTKALIRAGQGAVMDSRDRRGLEYFVEAKRTAVELTDVVDAAVGICLAALELGEARLARDALGVLSRVRPQGADSAIRRAVGQLVFASRIGGVASALEVGAAVAPLVDDARDRLVCSSFLNAYAHVLGLAGHYEEALDISNRQIAEATTYRLAFALPHGHLTRAVARAGRREFARAAHDVVQAEQLAGPANIHVATQAAALRARLCLHKRDFGGALRATSAVWHRRASRPMAAEYLAYRALALACVGQRDSSSCVATEAHHLHASSVETVTLTAWAGAIGALQADDRTTSAAVASAESMTRRTGGIDSFVTAVRAFPPLLDAVVASGADASVLRDVFIRSCDFKLGHVVGVDAAAGTPGPLGELTRRETEIAHLIGCGETNRAIAARLFLSESTVKVHVRHIFKKLDARSRAEVAAIIAGG